MATSKPQLQLKMTLINPRDELRDNLEALHQVLRRRKGYGRTYYARSNRRVFTACARSYIANIRYWRGKVEELDRAALRKDKPIAFSSRGHRAVRP